MIDCMQPLTLSVRFLLNMSVQTTRQTSRFGKTRSHLQGFVTKKSMDESHRKKVTKLKLYPIHVVNMGTSSKRGS